MRTSTFALFPAFLFLFTGCQTTLPPQNTTNTISSQHQGFLPQARSFTAHLSQQQLQAIGEAIWRNECQGSVAGLTTWNTGEGFASLGINHYLWFPANYRGQQFAESFPLLLDFLHRRGHRPPAWIRPQMACPWNTKAEFDRAQNSPELIELRQFLVATIADQSAFSALRLDRSLPSILQATPPQDRARVEHNFRTLAQSSEGLFALIDYVNFKGEGTNFNERYQGQGWGLAQVLQAMQAPHISAFARAADEVLTRRVANSPQGRNEARWLQGWRNRVYRYGNSL